MFQPLNGRDENVIIKAHPVIELDNQRLNAVHYSNHCLKLMKFTSCKERSANILSES